MLTDGIFLKKTKSYRKNNFTAADHGGAVPFFTAVGVYSNTLSISLPDWGVEYTHLEMWSPP